jgi:hypothetical protein
MDFRTINVKPNETCPVCGNHPVITGLVESEQAVCELKTKKQLTFNYIEPRAKSQEPR